MSSPSKRAETHSLPDCEQSIAVEQGYRIWSRSLGGGASRERTPLLILHGGPGVPHDYLQNLEALASPVQRVIFYDQLGCGRSDRPDHPELWQLPRFVTEVATVRQALGLDQVVILGQSWGGMLAIEYALTQPPGLHGLILSNSTPSASLWGAETRRLRMQLATEVRAVLDHHEAAGSTDSAAYQAAMGDFYARHVIRLQPLPAEVQRSFDQIGQPYTVMWGPSEFCITGNLKHWDRTDRLAEIRIPTLLISGEHDESTPTINQVMLAGLPDAEWTLLDGCSHLAHVEAPERYLAAVEGFLPRITLR